MNWRERITIEEKATDGEEGYERELAELPASLEGLRVLDASCVDGFWAVTALSRGAREALSLPAEGCYETCKEGGLRLLRRDQYRWCQAQLGARGTRARLTPLRLQDLDPEAHGAFDWTLLTSGVNRLRHLTLALDCVARVCRGRLLLSLELADHDNGEPTIEMDGESRWLPSQTALLQLLALSGFELEGITVYPASERGPTMAVVVASARSQSGET